MLKVTKLITAAVLVATMFPSPELFAADLSSFFREARSPYCGVVGRDFKWTACEWDKEIEKAGNCQIEVTVFQTVDTLRCAHVANGPKREVNITSGSEGESVFLEVVDALTRVRWPTPPDLLPTGPFMPEGACRELLPVLAENWGYFRKLDQLAPDWRSCMNRHSNNILNLLSSDRTVSNINKLNLFFESVDLDDSGQIDFLVDFVFDMEDEETVPVPLERVLYLLDIK